MGNVCSCPTGVHSKPTDREIESFLRLCALTNKDPGVEGPKNWDRICSSLHSFEQAARSSLRDEIAEQLRAAERITERTQGKRKHEPQAGDDSKNESADSSSSSGGFVSPFVKFFPHLFETFSQISQTKMKLMTKAVSPSGVRSLKMWICVYK